MLGPGRLISGAGLLLALLAGAASCTTFDPQVTPVGTLTPILVDPDLGRAAIDDPGIQVARWDIEVLEMTVPGGRADFIAGDVCKFRDTWSGDPTAEGLCARGLVNPESEDPIETVVDMSFTMEVVRAEPPPLPPAGDYDLDLVPNSIDNCPLIFNPDQEDNSGLGFPDACTVFVGGLGLLVDSDADLVADIFDNCIYYANLDQTDTNRDGIGDACPEQTATVNGGSTIEWSFLPEPFVQPFSRVLFMTFDFHGGDALQCDWITENCTLRRNEVEICVRENFSATGVTCDDVQ